MVLRPPADLVLVAAAGVLVAVVVAADLSPVGGLRPALVLGYLLFAPGYLLVASLFPDSDRREQNHFRPTPVQRALLSFGASVALVPLLALVPAVVGLPYEQRSFLLVLGGATAVGLAIAAYRRKTVPEPDRFRLGGGNGLSDTYGWVRRGDRGRKMARGLVVVSVLLAAVTFSYVLLVPQDGEEYSTMTLLSENESGDLVADDYPARLDPQEETELTLAVTNDRQSETTYAVVVRLERVESTGNTTRVVGAERLETLSGTVESGETWTEPHTVSPSLSREDLRLRYYLYVGQPPSDVNADSARDYLHIWVDVGTDGE